MTRTSKSKNQLGLFDPRSLLAPPAPAPIAVPLPERLSLEETLARRTIKPRRRRGAPGPADVESAGRDDALDALDAARVALVNEATKIAIQLAKQRGRVTSVEVWHAMLAFGYEDQLKGYDPRFMGCVFRRGWVEVGWESTGSHRRPVRIWKLP